MKFTACFATAFLLLPRISAHWSFWALEVNGNMTERWQYVRDPGRGCHDIAYLSDEPERFACNIATWGNFNPDEPEKGGGVLRSANTTEIFPVVAGKDDIGFQIGTKPTRYGSQCQPYSEWHPGPLSVYLSKAPTGNLREYDGQGEWFKIYELGLNMSVPEDEPLQWLPMQTTVKFMIPEMTPPGQYLLRFEHQYPHKTSKKLQFFINCAHIEVFGPGGGTPGPLVHITDYMYWDNPALLIDGKMWYNETMDHSYKIPGPPVWTGGVSNETVRWNGPGARRSYRSKYF